MGFKIMYIYIRPWLVKFFPIVFFRLHSHIPSSFTTCPRSFLDHPLLLFAPTPPAKTVFSTLVYGILSTCPSYFIPCAFTNVLIFGCLYISLNSRLVLLLHTCPFLMRSYIFLSSPTPTKPLCCSN